MKVAKFKKNKKEKTQIEQENYTLKDMIKILVVLFIIFALFYLVTMFLVKDRKIEKESTPAVVDSTKIIMTQLLNRKEQEYYVLATKSNKQGNSYVDTNYVEFYNNYINEYKQQENALMFYYIDLDNALNKKYLSDELNITNTIEDLKINDEVLFKIKEGKIEKSYVGKEKILDKLSRL